MYNNLLLSYNYTTIYYIYAIGFLYLLKNIYIYLIFKTIFGKNKL